MKPTSNIEYRVCKTNPISPAQNLDFANFFLDFAAICDYYICMAFVALEEVMDIKCTRKVIILVDSSRSFNRGLLCGLSRYAQLHGPWAVEMGYWNTYDIGLPQIERWDGEGILAAGIYSTETAQEIVESKLPAVTVENELADQLPSYAVNSNKIATIRTDSGAIGRIGAEYFLASGLRHFAFCGVGNRSWSRQRKESFQQRVQKAKLDCHIYPEPNSGADNVWEKERIAMANWLRTLPKPAGILACNDERACELTEAAHLAGVMVPDDVAVLGVDNDELICNLPAPPLSSIGLNGEKAGFEAAKLLDKLMAKKKVTNYECIAEPTGVVTRKSTDIVAVEDQAVSAAIRYIRSHPGAMIRVDDVVNATPLSRRLLECRFRQNLGRSILKEIQRIHIEAAIKMLTETDLSIKKVAHKTGFSSSTHLGVTFKQRMKMTPLTYRKAFRNGRF
ncbi:MAG: XylR family transcriptional regulator [Planctomycetota bacterium]